MRDGRGEVVFTGPVIFFPADGSYASEGAVKVPDAQPTQLGFEGFFLPTADIGPQGPYSAFPDALNPQVFLTAYVGDLGLGDGIPESVYTLDKTQMTQVRRGNGQPFARALSVGETMRLPGGQDSITFDGVSRFANFQIAQDPGKEISLAAAREGPAGWPGCWSARRSVPAPTDEHLILARSYGGAEPRFRG